MIDEHSKPMLAFCFTEMHMHRIPVTGRFSMINLLIRPVVPARDQETSSGCGLGVNLLEAAAVANLKVLMAIVANGHARATVHADQDDVS